jgi:hypothetical protein
MSLARAILALAGCCTAVPALAEQAVPTAEAVALFREHCLADHGGHAGTSQSLVKAAGFRVLEVSLSGDSSERILVGHASKSVEMSNVRLDGKSICFVGYTPAEPRDDAQAEAAEAIAAAVGVSADDFRKRGKELRLKSSAGLIKIVANRVYPISIGITSAYE